MGKKSKKSTIAKGAKISRSAVIGPFCDIGPDVIIEADCVLENNVTIKGKTRISEGTHIFPLVKIGLKSNGEPGVCDIGTANSIREHVVIAGGTEENPTIVGQNNLIMVACKLGSGTQIGNHVILANTTILDDRSVVEDYVRTSAFSHVCSDILVGAYAFIAGYVSADKTVPAYSMVQGEPMRVRGVNTHNLHGCGFGADDIRSLKRVYRDLFPANGAINEQQLEKIAADNTMCSYVRNVIDTILRQRQEQQKGAW